MDHCLICDAFIEKVTTWHALFHLDEPPLLCKHCESLVEKIPTESCTVCSKPAPTPICDDCRRWRESGDGLSENRSLFLYNEPMREWMHQFKFRGDTKLIEAFKSDWKALYRRHFSDYRVVPIPLGKKRMQERGFNQSLLLAELLDVPIYNCLVRTDDEQKQSYKSRYERMVSTTTFQISKSIDLDFTIKKVLLIDDIYTTGVTVRKAAQAFMRIDGTTIASMTFARSIEKNGR